MKVNKIKIVFPNGEDTILIDRPKKFRYYELGDIEEYLNVFFIKDVINETIELYPIKNETNVPIEHIDMATNDVMDILSVVSNTEIDSDEGDMLYTTTYDLMRSFFDQIEFINYFKDPIDGASLIKDVYNESGELYPKDEFVKGLHFDSQNSFGDMLEATRIFIEENI